MNAEERLFNTIDKIDDRYIVDAYNYKKRKKPVRAKVLAMVAACACLCMVVTFLFSRTGAAHISVYAYGSNQEIGWQKPTLMEGTISDSGEMHGSPLQFYITGKSIRDIRFSVKNEYISFMDWTEKRTNYGYSKSFTINYGDEADYYYLVVNWEPVSIIRELTDNADIGIRDLSKDQREDTIVMEVTYDNGDEESYAIEITLTDEGTFEAEVQEYDLSSSDWVTKGESENEDVQKSESENNLKNGDENALKDSDDEDNKDAEANMDQANISQSDLSRIMEVAKEYYEWLPYDVVDIVPDYDKTESEKSDYDGYDPDEILILKVTVKDDELDHYITIGSKDGWKNCSVLNEDY